jgi:hypothetical protein
MPTKIEKKIHLKEEYAETCKALLEFEIAELVRQLSETTDEGDIESISASIQHHYAIVEDLEAQLYQ